MCRYIDFAARLSNKVCRYLDFAVRLGNRLGGYTDYADSVVTYERKF